jgi:hypothetical protein
VNHPVAQTGLCQAGHQQCPNRNKVRGSGEERQKRQQRTAQKVIAILPLLLCDKNKQQDLPQKKLLWEALWSAGLRWSWRSES